MKKTLLYIILMYATAIFSQEKNINSPAYFFKDFQVVNLATEGIMQDVSRNSFFNLGLENPYSGAIWDLELYDSGLISDRYLLRTSEGGKIKSEVIATQGMIVGNPRSSVSLTLNHGFIYGFIDDGRDRYFIEPLRYFDASAGDDSFIVYKEKDVIERTYGTCGVTEMQRREKQIDREKKNHSRSVGECYTLEWAIANDFQMYQEYNTVIAVENHAVGVANNVQTNYDDEFADEISLEIVEMYVVTSSSSDPWTSSTNAGTLLDDFVDWGIDGGFSTPHAVGSLWTARDFNGSTVGIAYVGVVCGWFKYNALQDFTSNASTKRVMVAHELGHNFDADHDWSSSPHIMAPSVSTSTTWSSTSINSIENYYNSIDCMPSCTQVSAPLASFSYDVINECVQGEVQFTNSSSGTGMSYTWDFPGGTPSFSNDENPVVFYDEAGTYDVSLTVSNSAGQDVMNVNNAIDIYDYPEMGFSYTVNGSTVIINNLSDPVTFEEFDFGDGNFSTFSNPTHTYDEDGTYTITLYGENQCGNDSFSQVVTIATPPTANFTSNITDGCVPMTVNFTEQASENVVNYLWTFPGGNPNISTSPNPTVTYNTPGVYDVTLQVTNNQGNDVMTSTDLIHVKDLRDPSFTYNFDTDFQVSFQDLNDDGQGNYHWDFGDGNTSQDQFPTHTYAEPGDYTVTFTKTNICGDAQESQLINISSAPTANFTVQGSTTGCAGTTITFLNNSSPNTDNFQWNFPGGNPSTSTDENPSVVYNEAGVFSVTLVASNGAGSDVITYEDYILIEDIPQGNININVDENQVVFNNTYAEVDNHFWSFGDGTTSVEEDPIKIYEEDGTYTITYTGSNNCGDANETFQVDIVTPVIAAFTADNTTICPGEQIQLTSDASENVTSWSWTFPGGLPATSTQENPTVTYNEPGTYDILLEVSNAGYSDELVLESYIVVEPLPASDFEYEVIEGGNVDFTNASSQADSYTWDFGDGNTSNSVNPSHVYDVEGVYTVTLTSQNGCGVDVATQQVNTFGMVSAGFSADEPIGCAPHDVQFMNESSSNATTFLWEIDGPENFSSTEENPLITFSEAGVYSVTLTASNQEFSETIAVNEYITIESGPTAVVDFNRDGLVVNFFAGTDNIDSYLWDFGDGSQSTAEAPSHTYVDGGSYQVSLTVTNDCGTDTKTISINVGSPVQAGFIADTQEGCAPLTVEFVNMASDNATAFLWTFPGGNPSQSDNPNPVVQYLTPGVYDVSLTVWAAGGATDELTREDYVIVIEEPEEEFTYSVENGTITVEYDGNGEDLSWDLGDGTSVDGEEEFSHLYDTPGTYTVLLTGVNDCGAFSISKMVQVTMSSTEEESIADLQIYPNPTLDLINIEFNAKTTGELYLKVYDITGTEVLSRTVKALNTHVRLTEDLSILPSGTYHLRITSQFIDRYHKIVKL